MIIEGEIKKKKCIYIYIYIYILFTVKTGHSEPNGSSETQEGATLQDVSSVNKLQLFPLAGDNAEDRLSPPVLSDSISDGTSVYGPALPPPDTPAGLPSVY